MQLLRGGVVTPSPVLQINKKNGCHDRDRNARHDRAAGDACRNISMFSLSAPEYPVSRGPIISPSSVRGRVLSCSKPGEFWRHLADTSLSRHSFRQRSLHLRLSFPAMDRHADRDRGRDPPLHGRGDRGQRPRPAHPLSATRSSPRPGRAPTISGHSRSRASIPARCCA